MNEKKCYYYYLLSRKEKKNIMKKQRRLIRFLIFIWRGTSHPSVERNVKKNCCDANKVNKILIHNHVSYNDYDFGEETYTIFFLLIFVFN